MPKSLETPLGKGLLTTVGTPATAGNKQQNVPKTAGTPAENTSSNREVNSGKAAARELLPRQVMDATAKELQQQQGRQQYKRESEPTHCLKFSKINFTFTRHTPHKTHYCS